MSDPNQPQYQSPQYQPPQYSQPQYQPQYPAAPQPLSPQDERLWSMLIHLSGFVAGFLGPLIGYLVLRDRGPFIRWHTAQALNLQLTLLIGILASAVLMLVIIGFVTYFGVLIAGIVFMIMAAVKANAGEFYKVPATIQFVK